jgi:hypothetical protein
MTMIVPQITLVLAGSLALLNLWLSIRVGQVRRSEKVSIGDGGNDRVVRRMRAHANFGENGWVVLALVLAIELSVGSSVWLWAAAAVFVVARVLHGLGMDGWGAGRGLGTGGTMLVQLLLGLWAIAIPLTADRADGPAVESVTAQG